MFSMIASFLFFLFVFVAIGVYSVRFRKKETSDYLLAGRNVHPILVAFSAVATNWSGFMFVGMIGASYAMGISSSWILIGFVIGDYIVYNTAHEKIRNYSGKHDLHSLSGVVSKGSKKNYKVLRVLCGLITIAFLGAYAAGQLTAGSKALHVLMGWNYNAGAIIGAVMVLMYCYAGGIRASIWTDVAQSFVMMFAMFLLFIVSLVQIGGFASFFETLAGIDPNLLSMFPSDLKFGVVLFVLSMVFLGIGVLGQPHIMVRFMAIDDAKNIQVAKSYYFGWTILFCILTVFVGMFARILLPIEAFDPELALPKLSLQIFPGALVGVVLAGLFAGTMSTADSQILSCSTALTQDLFPKWSKRYLLTKLSTMFVTLLVLLIALFGTKSVYNLILLSWTLLGVAFAPLVIVNILKQKPSELLSILMIVLGIVALCLWRKLGYSAGVHEIMPGMLTAFGVFFVGKFFGMCRDKSMI